MSLFKRREYWLQLPDGTHAHAFQARSPGAAAVRAAQIAAARHITSHTLWRDPDATYSTKVSHRGKVFMADTGFRDLASAKRFESQYKRSLADDRLAELAGIRLRHSAPSLAMSDILPHWRAFAGAAGMAASTARGYEHAVRNLWNKANSAAIEDIGSLPVDGLSAALVFAFKAQISAAPDARGHQLRRSANSILRQAKGMFSRRALEHYRLVAKLRLPDTLREFLAAPGFAGTVKEDYELPSEDVMARTWSALDAISRAHQAGTLEDPQLRNTYVAIWLALGFGLRKSEIAAVRVGWITETPSGVQLHLRATVVPASIREKAATKNGSLCPRIDGTNDGWAHIKPFLVGLSPEDYVLRCDCATERVEGVFRHVSAWMRQLGWATSKTIHEFRAFAGCQVAMRDGIEAASQWMRHKSITVTQRHYGRYLRPRVTSGAIVTNAPFQPGIVV